RPAKEAGRRYREPVGWVLAKLVRVEPDGDRAVIDQRDVHMCSELAGGHIQAELAELLGQIVDQGTGNLRRGGSDEAGASALAGVGVQGELRDNQRAQPQLEGRAVHLAFLEIGRASCRERV